jgi:hypothetical protein
MMQDRESPRIGCAVLLLVAVISLMCPATTSSAREPGKAHVVMAGFLYKFFSFTEWPVGAYPPEGGRVSVCILGESPFGTIFAEVEGEDVGGRSLAVRHLDMRAGIREMSTCQVMFIPGSSRERIPGVLESLVDAPVLTVSDIEGFARHGGMIEFFEEGSRIQFIINRGAAGKRGIVFRARLLRVAAEVRD